MMPTASLRASRRAVASIFTLNGVVLASWVSHVPSVKTALRLSDGQLGTLLLAMALGAVSALSIVGWLNTRFGSRRMTLAMAVGLCLALPLPVLSPTVPAAAGALFVFGACNGALDVSMNTQAVLVEARWGQAIMSSFHGLFSLGGMLGATVAGLVMGAAIPAGEHVVAMMLAGLLIIAGVARWLPHDNGQARAGPVFVAPPRDLIALGAMGFIALMAEGAIGDWSAVWLRDTLHAAPATTAAGFATFSLAMAAGRFGGDTLSRRLGAVTLLQASGWLASGGLMAGLVAGRADAAVVGCGLVGLGVANMFPVLLSLAGRRAEGDAPRALAAVTSLAYLGFLAGPPAIGMVADVAGLPVGLGIVALGCAVVGTAVRGLR